MAKKRSKPIEPEVIEEVVEAVTEEDIIDDLDIVTESEIVEEAVIEVEEPVMTDPDKSNQFIYAQLKAINKISNPAKAKRLADRVLRNRKR